MSGRIRNAATARMRVVIALALARTTFHRAPPPIAKC
jgi:hypothetical protein